MNTKRVAATVIALALTAGCAIAQKADKDGQRKTQMEQIEKNAVGMWQRVTKHNGHTYYIPEFKIYTKDHEWYSFHTNMEKPGKFAGGRWEVVSPDSIVEHNDYSIDPAYDGNVDVYLKINTFKPDFHGISFVPRGYNEVVFMDYEKVEEKSSGSRGLLLGRDNIHFDNIDNYPLVSNSIRFFKKHDNMSEQVSLNQMPAKTKETLQSIAELAPELEADLADKDMITPFFDLIPINGGNPLPDGSHRVSMSIPTLTEGMTDVLVLHYSTQRSVWEIIEPEEVDYANQEITAVFADLSPVAIIANTDNAAAADTATGTSPQTGMSSSWMVWLGAAAVLAAAGAVTYRKARK